MVVQSDVYWLLAEHSARLIKFFRNWSALELSGFYIFPKTTVRICVFFCFFFSGFRKHFFIHLLLIKLHWNFKAPKVVNFQE